MAKINISGTNIAFASRFFHCCLIVVALGPICQKTSAQQEKKVTQEVSSVSPVFKLADNPVWDEASQSLFFVDGTEKLLINYKPNKQPTTVKLDDTVNLKFLAPVSTVDTKFVTGYGNGIGVFSWDGKSTQTLMPENQLMFFKHPNEVLECGKIDSKARLWIGTSYTVAPENKVKGGLYLLDPTGQATSKIGNFEYGVPGGMAWSPDETIFYYADTTANVIYGVDFDSNTDEINDGKVFFDFVANNLIGPPSSISVDRDGDLWVGCRKSNNVLQIGHADGKVKTTLTFPETNSVTSVAFGGQILDQLYVTTAADVAQPDKFPKSGTLFNVKGLLPKGLAVNGTDVQWPQAA